LRNCSWKLAVREACQRCCASDNGSSVKSMKSGHSLVPEAGADPVLRVDTAAMA
jgi:hypothetical protein